MSISSNNQPLDRSTEYVYAGSDAPSARSQSALLSTPPSGFLFSSFVSLAAASFLKVSNTDADYVLEHLQFKDLGIMSHSLVLLGYGSSFMVSVFSTEESIAGLEKCVLKRTIPLARKQNEAIFQNRINAMMLELRTLTHDPIRQHENIVKFLGITWETDPFDIERKWPVFLMERAMNGTLVDVFQTERALALSTRLNLILDVILGLEILHSCGIIHGDVKLENILVFDSLDNSTVDRPFIAKLADFGGSIFDVSTTSRLSSGTQPWNAPEWRERLDPKALQLTDIYSLGFVMWRILANGEHPFPVRAQFISQQAWQKEIENLKATDEGMEKHLTQVSTFETEVERRLVEATIKRTIKKDPADRSIAEVKHLVQALVKNPRATPDFGDLARHQYQLRNTFLPYSSQGIMDSIDPSIVQYISKELLRAAQTSSHRDEIAEAKYGLSELSINGSVVSEQGGISVETCLNLAAESAEAGSERAQAIFYRLCTALNAGTILVEKSNHMALWLLNSASKGYFQPLEDMLELKIPEIHVDNVLRTLRFRYSGTGHQRYNDFPPRSTARQPWETSALQIKNFDESLIESYKGIDTGYIGCKVASRYGDNLLHHAASCGLRETVSYLIGKDSSNINCVNIIGETPLLLASRSGHYFITRELLEAGADPKIADNNGETPLHWLLSFNTKYVKEVCQYLVEKLDQNDVDAVASEYGYVYCGENKYVSGTPLMRAVVRNRLDVVQALLGAGADPSFISGKYSALGLAAHLHYHHLLEVLLPKVSPTQPALCTVQPSTVQPLLMFAIRGGSLEAPGTRFGRIRRHGHQWICRAFSTLKVLLDRGPQEDLYSLPGTSGTTALLLAATLSEADIVEFLLEHGCQDIINKPSKVNDGSEDQYTPLMGSIYSKKFPVFCLLVQRGANTKTSYGPDSYTLLYDCAQSSNDQIEFARLLIDSGVPVDQSPDGYETPFACALRNRCFNLAKFLWENGANINIEYRKGRFLLNTNSLTVLGHLIVEYAIGTLACLNFLLYHRPQLSAPNFVVSHSDGLTALHVIAMAPYAKQNDHDLGLILGCILDYFEPSREQLSLPCYCNGLAGYTALHIAVIKSNYAVVRGLLGAGADPDVKNTDGYTALEFAHHTLMAFPDTFEFGSLEVPERTLKKAKERAEDILRTIQNAYPDAQG